MANFDDRYLLTDSTWNQRLGHGWKGKETLGKGGYGTVVLWEYEGDEESAPGVKQVAIKFTMIQPELPDTDWHIEGRLMEQLAKARSRHTLRMYGPQIEEKYQGKDVTQLLLEYCPGGDMSKLFEEEDRESILPDQPLRKWGCLGDIQVLGAWCFGYRSWD